MKKIYQVIVSGSIWYETNDELCAYEYARIVRLIQSTKNVYVKIKG